MNLRQVVFLGSHISRRDFDTFDSSSADFSIQFVDIAELLRNIHIEFAKSGPDVTFQKTRDLLGKVIWYHPGAFDLFDNSLIQEDTEYKFLARQFHSVLKFLEFWLAERCRCIDLPSRQRFWSNKLIQLARLSAVMPDLVAPTCLLTDFARLQPGKVIKHTSESRLLSARDWFLAKQVDDEVMRVLLSEQVVPILMQELIEQKEEYRAFVCGEESVTIALPREELYESVDVHSNPACLTRARLISTTPILYECYLRIKKLVGLEIFALDYFIVNEKPVILEVNPLASWAWLPIECQKPLTHLYHRFLTQKISKDH